MNNTLFSNIYTCCHFLITSMHTCCLLIPVKQSKQQKRSYAQSERPTGAECLVCFLVHHYCHLYLPTDTNNSERRVIQQQRRLFLILVLIQIINLQAWSVQWQNSTNINKHTYRCTQQEPEENEMNELA